ncbi:MAG: hypothetical protein ACLRYY_10295 [Anaerobutyricum soehngenii]
MLLMGICRHDDLLPRLDYHIWQKKWWFAWVIYGGVIGLLLLTFAIGAASHGSQRWLSIDLHSVFSLPSLPKIGIDPVSGCIYQAAGQDRCAQWKRTGYTVSSCY